MYGIAGNNKADPGKHRWSCQQWVPPIYLLLTAPAEFANCSIRRCVLPMFNSVIQKQISLQ